MVKIIKSNGVSEYEFINAKRQLSDAFEARVDETVLKIIENVKKDGDKAVREYTAKFDKGVPECFEVSKEEIDKALLCADKKFVDALINAKKNIMAFHERQKTQSFVDIQPNGVILGQKVRGLKRVGIYVPGGTASYPSSVLMNAIPAKVAGVQEVVMTTPPAKDGKANPDVLAAAAICGVDRVFLMGGAQAIAAFVFGTETVPKVDKIVGPGNIYIATAKKLLFGKVDIDMIAGPSEILIIADETANPAYIAADMMGQAEHDVMASSILLTTSEKVAELVNKELEKQIEAMPRKTIIKESLEKFGAIILCSSENQMVEMANELAPEHLEVQVKDPMRLLGSLDSAGSVFIGEYTPEPLGDYYAGPNHVLPTSGTARFFSPLGVDSFVKRSAFISYTKEAMQAASKDVMEIARREGLYAHENAVKVRLNG